MVEYDFANIAKEVGSCNGQEFNGEFVVQEIVFYHY